MPPKRGPTAAPSPDTAAQMLNAVARSRGLVKITRMRDSVVGMIIAPPMPRRARIVMTASGVSVMSTPSEATANIEYPSISMRFRPKQSAMAANETSSPACISE